ncbi:MAG: hypothetical protein COB45_03475 [Gammaproteobacteria bacterium]|nr:MAG: hypothetical protein COB45_03475 [Gammaproteobacteria bacterium]
MILNEKISNCKSQKNTLPFNKKLIAVLISSSLLFACGGGGGGGGGSTIAQNISGTASKGLILGGVVTAYLINPDGTKGDEIGTTTTNDTNGSYELTLGSSYNGEALIIEITATDGSKMKCDLSVCLADDDDEVAITFGELYTLPTDFELSAVSSGADSGTISINITPLTNIAAALALDKVADGADPAAAAAASNYQIAELLGLDGDVTELPIVDLTDADAINAADADALEANLKSAAVVEAALSGSTAGTSLEAALESFVTQYVTSNGVAETEGVDVDTASVSLEEIAAASQELTSIIVTELEGVSAEDENMAAVETALIAEEADAAMGSTEPTQGDIPDDVGSEGLVATKAFVSQVSTFNLAAQLDSANTFEDEISLATDITTYDLDVSAEALSLAAAAIAEAVEAVVDSETPLTTYTYESELGNITVAISISGDTVTYTVAQTLNIEDSTGVTIATVIDLVAVNAAFSNTIEEMEIEGTTENPDFTWEIEGEASLDLALSGSVSTALVSITINEGSHFIATLAVDEEEAGEYTNSEGENSGSESRSETASGLISVTGVDAALSVTIAQVASDKVTDPISFTGAFNVAATLLSIEYDETEQYDQSYTSSDIYTDERSSTNSETETISVDGLTASLSGIFSNSSKSLEATLALAASGIVETCVWENEWSNTYTNNNGVVDNSNTHDNSDDCSLTGETAESYASASINVRLSLDVDGIDNDVELVAAIQRTGLESGIASIDLTYGGNQLDFDFNSDNIIEEETGSEEVREVTTTITATLTNHNGVILTLTGIQVDEHSEADTNDSTVMTGVISHEGEEFATVSDEGVVTFSDGTFVTL